jgi:hypothetical protein
VNFPTWLVGITKYTCKVTEASITNPETTIKSFIGNHKPGKINKDVEAIYFLGTKVEYFPRGLHLIFPRLESRVAR